MKTYLTINSVLLAVCLLFLSCSSSNAAKITPTDGDQSGSPSNLGERCSKQSDCPENADCLLLGENGLHCTHTCSAKEDCADVGADWSCRKESGVFYCVLPSTPADGDAAETEREHESAACTPDTLHCKDAQQLERCTADGQSWIFYRECPSGKHCAGASCVEGDCAVAAGAECCPGQFRCFLVASQNDTEVQRCDAQGNWQFYRDCEAPKVCLDGACQTPQGGDQDTAEAADSDTTLTGDPCTVADGCVSPNEYCFVEYSGTGKGICQPYCGKNGVSCQNGYRCVESQCQAIPNYCLRNESCAMTQYCQLYNGGSDGLCQDYCFTSGFSCPAGSHCNESADDPLTYGKCVNDTACTRCTSDVECGDGNYCYKLPGTTSGCCRKMCSKDSCGGGQVCVNGRCQAGTDRAECPFPCSTGYICDTQYGQCALDCPVCNMNAGYYCDATTGRQCKYDPNHCFVNPPLLCGLGLADCCPGQTCNPVIEGLWGYCI